MARKHYVFRKKRNVAAARVLDALGSVLPRPAAPEPVFGRVLVVRLDHIGDALLATAIPRMIVEAFSGARVSFLAASWAAPLLENNPHVEETIVYDAPWFSKGRHDVDTQGYRYTARVLASRGFDTALAPRGDLRENLLLKIAGIPARVGYGVTGGGFLLTKEVEYRPDVHQVEHTTDLLRAVGVNAIYPGPQLHFTAEEENRWAARRESLGLPAGVPLVGFQAAAGTPSKEWGNERARRFLDEARALGATIVLTGTERDKARFAVPPMEGVVDLRGQTSLREFCLFVRGCRAFVGPDSGPTHVASALGVPTVFLFSGTNRFEEWRPLAPNARVLRRSVDCAPCALEECVVKGHPCMAGIAPEDVLSALAEAIA